MSRSWWLIYAGALGAGDAASIAVSRHLVLDGKSWMLISGLGAANLAFGFLVARRWLKGRLSERDTLIWSARVAFPLWAAADALGLLVSTVAQTPRPFYGRPMLWGGLVVSIGLGVKAWREAADEN